MDIRWEPFKMDSKRYVRVLLHQTASIYEVRRGTNAEPPLDLTPYVTDSSQSAFETNITFAFNRELFGDNQPKPNQVLEVQLKQQITGDEWRPVWIGDVTALTSFNMSRGERQMQLIAKTREQQDVWKHTTRMTPLFPQMTDLGYIIMRIARSAGMVGDEIMLPFTSIKTAHNNTQLADMNAWDMMGSIFTALGWTPFIDGIGRLRAADRNLQARGSDIVLSEERLVRVHGSRYQPPVSRVRLSWMSPLRKKQMGQTRIVGTPYTVTLGWWQAWHKYEFFFSEDKTQRAVLDEVKPNPSVNTFKITAFVSEEFEQLAENSVKFRFINFEPIAMAILTTAWMISSGSWGSTGFLTSGYAWSEWLFQAAFIAIMINTGTGVYEVWATPYEWLYPRNISEAFDDSSPVWVDNSSEFENNLVTNEEHAQGIVVRELIYQARQASQWSATIVDDPRIEFGDILEFPDGEQLYVEDFSRRLERGGEALLDVKGFLLGPPAIAGGAVTIVSPPTIPGDGTPGDTDGLPPEGPAIVGEPSENNTCDTAFAIPGVEGEYTRTINTAGNLTDPTTGFGGSNVAYHAAWWVFVPPANGSMTINLAGSKYDTQLAVFSGSCEGLVLAGFNDDQGIAKHSFIEVPVFAGQPLYIMTAGYSSHMGGELSFITYYNAV